MRATVRVLPREPLTKGGRKQLRRNGLIPITLSAAGAETRQLAAPARELADLIRRGGTSAVVELEVGGGERALAIPRDIQRDPVTGNLLHVGFKRISGREPVTADVRVTLVGEPESVRHGIAYMDQEALTVSVRALPDRLPTHIQADVSGLEVGGVLRVSDLPPAPDYEILSPPDTVLATVHTTRAAVAAAEEHAPGEQERQEQAA